LAVEGI